MILFRDLEANEGLKDPRAELGPREDRETAEDKVPPEDLVFQALPDNKGTLDQLAHQVRTEKLDLKDRREFPDSIDFL